MLSFVKKHPEAKTDTQVAYLGGDARKQCRRWGVMGEGREWATEPVSEQAAAECT